MDITNTINSLVIDIDLSINQSFAIRNLEPKPKEQIKICVAMSGGVDSSVCGALLKHAGYNVEGVTLKLYESAVERTGRCCSFRDIFDAKRVAQQFNFPHYVINYEKAFKKEVIDDFAAEYIAGRTPVPCIRCNAVIKFNYMHEFMKKLDFDFIVTGHYVVKDFDSKYNSFYLREGSDPKKDQTYYLYGVNSKQLETLLFPLGRLCKSETREIAQYFGVQTSMKPDSQDICFVENGSYRDFLEASGHKSKTGNIVNSTNDKVVGKHDGIHNFTIGQRRGIGVSGPDPLYVNKIDATTGDVYIGPKQTLAKKEAYFHNVCWVNDEYPDEFKDSDVYVRLRSMHKNVKAKLSRCLEKWLCTFEQPQYLVTPGQSIVIYCASGRLLGGGLM